MSTKQKWAQRVVTNCGTVHWSREFDKYVCGQTDYDSIPTDMEVNCAECVRKEAKEAQ